LVANLVLNQGHHILPAPEISGEAEQLLLFAIVFFLISFSGFLKPEKLGEATTFNFRHFSAL
jgi:hypothetical protein